jgi:hypothetical protein
MNRRVNAPNLCDIVIGRRQWQKGRSCENSYWCWSDKVGHPLPGGDISPMGRAGAAKGLTECEQMAWTLAGPWRTAMSFGAGHEQISSEVCSVKACMSVVRRKRKSGPIHNALQENWGQGASVYSSRYVTAVRKGKHTKPHEKCLLCFRGPSLCWLSPITFCQCMQASREILVAYAQLLHMSLPKAHWSYFFIHHLSV